VLERLISSRPVVRGLLTAISQPPNKYSVVNCNLTGCCHGIIKNFFASYIEKCSLFAENIPSVVLGVINFPFTKQENCALRVGLSREECRQASKT